LASMVRQANKKSVPAVLREPVEMERPVIQKKVKKIKTEFNFGFLIRNWSGKLINSFIRPFQDLYQVILNWRTNFVENFSFKKLAYRTLAVLLLASLPFPSIAYYRSVKDTSNRVVE